MQQHAARALGRGLGGSIIVRGPAPTSPGLRFSFACGAPGRQLLLVIISGRRRRSKAVSDTDRRSFLKLMGAGALAASVPPSIRRALAVPAHHRTGTIKDVEHIVILMQENRSFDHY